jgi:hypothetical protein
MPTWLHSYASLAKQVVRLVVAALGTESSSWLHSCLYSSRKSAESRLITLRRRGTRLQTTCTSCRYGGVCSRGCLDVCMLLCIILEANSRNHRTAGIPFQRVGQARCSACWCGWAFEGLWTACCVLQLRGGQEHPRNQPFNLQTRNSSALLVVSWKTALSCCAGLSFVSTPASSGHLRPELM